MIIVSRDDKAYNFTVLKNSIKNLFRMFGLDVVRYRKKTGPLDFLKTLNIRTIIDIGANIGEFSSELRKVLPEARIYAFEPLRECFGVLTKKFSGNKNFFAFNFALGDNCGEIEIHKSKYMPSSSILEMADKHKESFPASVEQTNERIKIDRLDNALAGKELAPEILIKIDVQGFEDKVIAGGQNTIREAKVIIIENSFVELYRGQKLFADIYKILTGLGFSYFGSISSKKDPKTGSILFEDSVFMKLKA